MSGTCDVRMQGRLKGVYARDEMPLFLPDDASELRRQRHVSGRETIDRGVGLKMTMRWI